MSSYLLKLADIGGHGGGSFDHRDDLSQLGLAMGCGSSSGVRLSSMHIEQHRVLSHLQASYSRCAEPSAQAAVPVTGTGNIMSTADGKVLARSAGAGQLLPALFAEIFAASWSQQQLAGHPASAE